MNLIASTTVAVIILSTADAGFVSKTGSRQTSATETALAGIVERSLEDPIPEEVVCLNTLGRNRFSKAIPFMKRPPLLDGTYPGDSGFDPLEFAKTEEDLMRYRQAEVKHGRLAMLAAIGWPLSELFDEKIADTLDLPPMLDSAGRAPSVLNNFEGISPYYWFAVLTFAAYVDTYGIFRSTQGGDQTFPGDLGFDPLRLYPDDERDQRFAQLAEIKHGRLAMIVVLIYTLEELLSDSSIILPTL